MATVYLAHDLKLRRSVAVKVLREELALAVRAERFLQEINFAALLNHPYIVPLHEAGHTEHPLYYVMPYVQGETLRERLEREGALPIAEAIQVCREVAEALGYAHAQGVVHRDIKPGNILFSGGHALVADFGIARALFAAEDGSLTATGPTLGTPGYMSPEQIAGREVDGRSDIYSLGCVLFEALAGRPPFVGPSSEAVRAQHVADVPKRVRAFRRDVPPLLERVVQKALAKRPEDRFPTAAELAEALKLERPVSIPWAWPRVTWRRALATLIPLGLMLAAIIVGPPPPSRALNPTRYLVLPTRGSTTAPASEYGEALLHDALSRWTGITVVDRQWVLDHLAGRHSGAPDGRAALDLARESQAGRYIWTFVSQMGDSTRVEVVLYDAVGDSVLRERTIRLGPGLVRADSTFAALVDQLLFSSSAAEPTGTHSYPARLAFERGQAAVREWELVKADSAFVEGTETDVSYAQAYVWLAQVRFWKDTVTATWRSSAERGASGRARLTLRDQLLSDALQAYGRGDVVRACDAWRELTQRRPYEFAGWYGLATCLSRDDAVVRDSKSPSGWAFRSSYYRAAKAYERAFQLLPSIHRALSTESYASVRRLLYTDAGQWRGGRAYPSTVTEFAAFPSWRHDTLAFVPYPRKGSTPPAVVPPDLSLAVHRQRELFRDIATAWATELPPSADALEVLAISRELLEDPAAIATIRQARSLATNDPQRWRLAGAEVWMRVKFSVPGDPEGLRVARALADSVVLSVASTDTDQPLLLASLAALTGRAQVAAALSRTPRAATQWGVPPQLQTSALPLLIFAAFGGPLDTVRHLERQVDSVIEQRLLPSARQDARIQWLVRPGRLAFPSYHFESLPKLAATGDFLIGAEAALLRGDTGAVQQVFARVRARRRAAPLSSVNLEGLYPEAHLLAALGDPRPAITWLDGTLGALAGTDPRTFTNPANAGALGQAMALRADLARQVGDTVGARRWAAMVVVLWSDCDSFLHPILRRMQGFASGVM